MKIKSFNIFINEEFIGDILDPINLKDRYNVYKNPINLKKITPRCRGIIDKYGNLFIADTENITHYDLSKYLNRIGYSFPTDKNLYRHFDKIVPVQRYENTNDFYIGEGFRRIFDDDDELKNRDIDQFFNDIQIILNKAKLLNPNINFNIDVISDVFFLK